eukprot:TRINITY_DN9463_c0_g1_i1.p1 TRINITY_DN9463_c0_g1~~TRINITY_DN9463_c0_g1_i1.p1  ORF type:complete len:141 (-),score=34.27 TRINITY_DN9463_c0_g1_i1:443-865(-)
MHLLTVPPTYKGYRLKSKMRGGLNANTVEAEQEHSRRKVAFEEQGPFFRESGSQIDHRSRRESRRPVKEEDRGRAVKKQGTTEFKGGRGRHLGASSKGGCGQRENTAEGYKKKEKRGTGQKKTEKRRRRSKNKGGQHTHM